MCFAIGGMRAAASRTSSSTHQAVLQADQSLLAAVAESDNAALHNLLDANLQWTEVDGKTINGPQSLQEIPALLTTAGGQANTHM